MFRRAVSGTSMAPQGVPARSAASARGRKAACGAATASICAPRVVVAASGRASTSTEAWSTGKSTRSLSFQRVASAQSARGTSGASNGSNWYWARCSSNTRRWLRKRRRNARNAVAGAFQSVLCTHKTRARVPAACSTQARCARSPWGDSPTQAAREERRGEKSTSSSSFGAAMVPRGQAGQWPELQGLCGPVQSGWPAQGAGARPPEQARTALACGRGGVSPTAPRRVRAAGGPAAGSRPAAGAGTAQRPG